MTRLPLAIVAVILAACGPAVQVEPPASFGVAVTPASVAGQSYSADATYAAAEAQRNAAELAAIEATAGAARVTADARATIDAQSFSATATAQHLAALIAQDAATAEAGRATRDAETTRAAVTLAQVGTREAQANLRREVQREEARQEAITDRANVRAIAITAVIVVFLGGLAAVILAGIRGIFGAKELEIKANAFAQLVRHTPAGVMSLANSQLEYAPRMLAPVIDGEVLPEIDGVGRIPFTANGQEQPPITVAHDSNPERTNRALATYLLHEARNYLDRTGGERNVMPGHRHLPLNADEWSRAVQLLKDNRIAYTEPRRGTYFHEGWDVDIALREVQAGRLDFSPTRAEAVR